MGYVTVADIKEYPLSRIPTDGGDVLHALKNSDQNFTSFGEAYFSEVKPGWVKAWKQHTQMSMNLYVPIGKVMFVFIDANKKTRIITLGEGNYSRVFVPPLFWFGFKGLSKDISLILNIANITHSDDEVLRQPKDFFSFDWENAK